MKRRDPESPYQTISQIAALRALEIVIALRDLVDRREITVSSSLSTLLTEFDKDVKANQIDKGTWEITDASSDTVGWAIRKADASGNREALEHLRTASGWMPFTAAFTMTRSSTSVPLARDFHETCSAATDPDLPQFLVVRNGTAANMPEAYPTWNDTVQEAWVVVQEVAVCGPSAALSSDQPPRGSTNER